MTGKNGLGIGSTMREDLREDEKTLKGNNHLICSAWSQRQHYFPTTSFSVICNLRLPLDKLDFRRFLESLETMWLQG